MSADSSCEDHHKNVGYTGHLVRGFAFVLDKGGTWKIFYFSVIDLMAGVQQC